MMITMMLMMMTMMVMGFEKGASVGVGMPWGVGDMAHQRDCPVLWTCPEATPLRQGWRN